MDIKDILKSSLMGQRKMPMSDKGYPERFRTEAVKQVVDRGHSVSGVATRFDITPHSL